MLFIVVCLLLNFVNFIFSVTLLQFDSFAELMYKRYLTAENKEFLSLYKLVLGRTTYLYKCSKPLTDSMWHTFVKERVLNMKVRQHRHKLYTESVTPGSIPQQERLVNPKWDTMHKTTQNYQAKFN